ncbi:hypothetical protein A3K88_08070 [Pseudomonas putida]|nr:hypothetical protein A3K88_08070 [Pseudomonas putida]
MVLNDTRNHILQHTDQPRAVKLPSIFLVPVPCFSEDIAVRFDLINMTVKTNPTPCSFRDGMKQCQ